MEAISFIITNFNTKKYTEFVYNSIRKNLGYVHEIVMLDDGSEDGTWEILEELKSKDHNMIIHKNDENLGIPHAYNKMVELSSNDIVCMLHSDMHVPPKFDEIMLKYMEEYDFITPLRVEPDVGYPGSVDKLLINFGTESENFDEYKFNEWHETNIEKNKGRVEQRMFFPWMIKKKLYNEIGGNDELFSKYMVDDDDFYLRVKMSGAKYTQVFETAVYHMPSKSVRMREDDSIKVDVDGQYQKSIRNFIRKWGTWPGRVWDENRDMIIPKKHDIGFVVNNCTSEVLHALEPWCNTIYVDDPKLLFEYYKTESKKTLYNIEERVKLMSREKDNDVLISFDCFRMNDEKFNNFLTQLPLILESSGQVGKMEYDIFFLDIKSLDNMKIQNVRRL